jgi:indole-3-glycerol phosphate synthase
VGKVSVLDKILANKAVEIENLTVPNMERQKPVLDFKQALLDRNFICEVKKASPTLGDINTGAEPEVVAKMYESFGAAAVSVLTDKTFFKGSFTDLKYVAKAVNIPVLCKDFIISEKQIDIAYRMGADAFLLMATSLKKEEYERLYSYGKSLGLHILVEIHEPDELEVVRDLKPEILGVNARNLKTLEIDKEHAADIIREIGDFDVIVAESGMKEESDIRLLSGAGANAFLVGSSLMGAKDPKSVFDSLKRGLLCS